MRTDFIGNHKNFIFRQAQALKRAAFDDGGFDVPELGLANFIFAVAVAEFDFELFTHCAC